MMALGQQMRHGVPPGLAASAGEDNAFCRHGRSSTPSPPMTNP
jgi:hypothetical protein